MSELENGKLTSEKIVEKLLLKALLPWHKDREWQIRDWQLLFDAMKLSVKVGMVTENGKVIYDLRGPDETYADTFVTAIHTILKAPTDRQIDDFESKKVAFIKCIEDFRK